MSPSSLANRCLLSGLLWLALSNQAMADAPPAPAEVAIRKMTFHPATLTIKAGTTVRWQNQEAGATYHSIVSDEPGQFLSNDFFPGEAWQHTFTTPGVYPYHCGPHENRMRGQVIVEP
ncbi:MAG: cupredoxin domain-containing protein [Magnetococcales bacterium]|nr:cupredoxin domain-containing protein [Magnetococcales bacterium]